MRRCCLLFCAALLALLSGVPGHAAAQAPTDHPVDVVVVIDDSGSMGTCTPWLGRPLQGAPCPDDQLPPNDPLELRYSAARLLVRLADNDDRLALVRFGTGAEPIGSGQLERVGGPEHRSALLGAITPPATYENGGYTRIDLGLALAAQILQARDEPHRPAYVLFLTDGAPTQPDYVGGYDFQSGPVRASAEALRAQGVQIFPVALCVRGDCPVEFLDGTMGGPTRRAGSAEELLPIFSDIFSRMKPNLHVVSTRNADGALEIFTRAAHGVQQLMVVTARDGFGALNRDGQPQAVIDAFDDASATVKLVESSAVAEGRWTAQTSSAAGFMVARAATYPEILHPPPAVAGSAAAPSYVPAGRPVMLVASVVGPGGIEPLLLDQSTPLNALTSDNLQRFTVLPPGRDSVTLQVGADTQPLQIARSFQIVAREGLPVAQAITPACAPGRPCALEARFGPGAAIEGLSGAIYVSELGENGEKPVYQAELSCAERACVADGFQPEDGRAYLARFLLQATAEGVRFGDWAETTLTMRPAVYVTGLAEPLDLRAEPAGGWPVTVAAGTTEALGRLKAILELRRLDDDSIPTGLNVLFGADIAGTGEQETQLRVEGIDGLRPGHYGGQIRFALEGAPADVQLPAPVAIDFTIDPPVATIGAAAVDFGTASFDPSPNFRLDQEVLLPVGFNEAPFALEVADVNAGDCEGLRLGADLPRPDGAGGYHLPLRLQSDRPIAPGACRGTLVVRSGVPDAVVRPATPVHWQTAVASIEWEIQGAEQGGALATGVDFGHMGGAGEEGWATLRVRYSGKPPFRLSLREMEGGGAGAALPAGGISLVTGAPEAVSGAQDVYRLPVALMSAGSLPHDWWSGTRYSGRLTLGVEGLPGETGVTVPFSFHSPGVRDRVVVPWARWMVRFPFPGMLTAGLLLGVLALSGGIVAGRMNETMRRAEESARRRFEASLPPPTPLAEPVPAAADARPRRSGGAGRSRPDPPDQTGRTGADSRQPARPATRPTIGAGPPRAGSPPAAKLGRGSGTQARPAPPRADGRADQAGRGRPPAPRRKR